jgi:DNA-binding phage protein
MLRVSATATNTTIDIQGISGDASAAAQGIEHGPELMRFAESLARRNEPELTAARRNLLEVAGPGVLVDAAGVAANFQRMVRIADSTGIPVDNLDNPLSQQIRADLGLDTFSSAGNSLPTATTTS